MVFEDENVALEALEGLFGEGAGGVINLDPIVGFEGWWVFNFLEVFVGSALEEFWYKPKGSRV